MSEKQPVPDHVPKVHEPGPGQSAEDARELDLALWEMEQEDYVDETAVGQHAPAEIGYSSHSLHKGVSASPKHHRHDTPFVQLKNAHPYLDSGDIEALMEHVYGKSILEAAAENYRSFDKSRLADVLTWDQVTAENYVGANPFADYDDSEADEEDDDSEAKEGE